LIYYNSQFTKERNASKKACLNEFSIKTDSQKLTHPAIKLRRVCLKWHHMTLNNGCDRKPGMIGSDKILIL